MWTAKTWDLLSLFTSDTECFFFFPYWTRRPAGDMKDTCSLLADGASERLFPTSAQCFLDCPSLFVLCFSQPESDSAPPVRCDSEERRLISTWGLQNECHYIATTPCNSPQATSPCASPAVPRTIHGRTLTGRAIMVTDALAIWNGYSCQDLRRLAVLRNRFSNGSANQEGCSPLLRELP